MRTIMIVGIGQVGSWALEMLAREPGVEKIIAADINKNYASRRANAAQCGASHLGYYPEIVFEQVDVKKVNQTGKVLKEINPDVILSTVTLISAYAAEALPKEEYELVEDAGIGPFLPCHLLLQYKLLQAIDEAGIDPFIVESSFPDVISPILHRADCKSPHLGVGNLDNLVPVVQMQVARKMGVSMRNVRVYYVGSHFNNVWFTRRKPNGIPPYWIKILVNNRDVTDQFDTDELLLNTSKNKLRLGGTEGIRGSSLTASSAVKHTLAFYNLTDLFSHSPGPKGLPGGYPIKIEGGKIEVALPDSITLEEAIKINEEGLRRDGIEEIADDGTVIFTDKSASLIKEAIGYDCKSLELNEVAERAEELLAKYKEHIMR